MTITAEMKRAAPDALYGCAKQSCADQKSVRASELWWYRAGFYCALCMDAMVYEAQQANPDHADDHLHHGPTLAKAIEYNSTLIEFAPEPVYPCTTHECAVEVSYPADMLSWFNDGFYCYECIEDATESAVAYEARHNGPSLAEVLKIPGVVE